MNESRGLSRVDSFRCKSCQHHSFCLADTSLIFCILTSPVNNFIVYFVGGMKLQTAVDIPVLGLIVMVPWNKI
jgi:hypothetical protein